MRSSAYLISELLVSRQFFFPIISTNFNIIFKIIIIIIYVISKVS